MSDLPTRMIARAVRATAGVMPVVPSRYESSFVSPAFFEVSGEQPGAQAAPDLPAPRRSEAGSIEGTAADAGANVSEDRPDGSPSAPEVRSRNRAAALTNREPVEPARSAAFDSGEPAQRDRVPLSLQDFRPDSAARTRTEIQAEPSAQATLPSDNDRRAELAITQHFYSTPVYSTPVAERSPEAFPRRREGVETRTAAPEPVEVHVSIGHIELRQSAPPAPPPRPRPAVVQHVRLADYLKRRSGETR